MSSALVIPGLLHVLLVALLATLPPRWLVQPGLPARLGLGALCGLLSLAIAAYDARAGGLSLSPVQPALVASAAFLWGPAAGALAATAALAGAGLVTAANWQQALAIAASAAGLGLLWWLALRRRVPVWAAAVGLALTLPLLLAAWTDTQAAQHAQGLAWLAVAVPWRFGLGVAVLCGGAVLLRSHAQSLLALAQREDELARTLRAAGGGRWEWDVRGQRLSYGGRLYRHVGLRDSPEDGALVHLPGGSRAFRRWARERHHPQDVRRLAPHLRQVLAGHAATLQAELRLRDDQGQWRWLVWRGHAVEHDAGGRVLRLSGMCLDVSEQREMREALLASQAQYTAVYQTLPDASGIARLADGRYLDVNPAFERLLGMARARVVGRTSSELGIQIDEDEYQRLLDALREQGEARGMPITLRRGADSASGLVSARAAQVEGEPCMVFVFHDLTHELRLRAELLASNSLLRQAGRMARLGAWEMAPGPGEGYWSEVCCDIHGLAPGSPLPRNYVQAFVAPEWRDAVQGHLRRCVAEALAWDLEVQILRPGGERLWVRVRGEPVLEAGRVVRMRGIMQDIDEMRRASQRLLASEERLARVFQMLPTPLGFSRRSDGTYLDVNPAWEQFTGHSRERSIGQSAIGLGICTPEARAGLMQAAARGDTRAHEMEIVTATGERRTVLQSLCPVDLRGEACWLFAMVDITERKHSEQRVREREELLSLTISAASLGLWDWDLAHGTLSGDARWRDMWGLAPGDERQAEPWPQALAQADPAAVSAELARHLAEPGLPFDVTCRAGAHGAGARWIRNLGTVVAWHADGAPQRMVGMSMDVTSQRAQAQQLERMAHYDALTGLPNRVLLERRLREGMQRSLAQERKLGVGYLDLDGFKPVNDRLGHAAGDQLLVQVAERLQRALRAGDCVARLGGDEFVVLLADLASGEECEQRLRTLMQGVSAPYQLGSERVVVTASIGYTLHPDDSADADTLLRHADQAMYAAKQAGRNRYHAFDAAHERTLLERRGQCERLVLALERGELALYLQPKVDMRSGAVVGAEALARWRHPEHGVLSPAHFLPLLDGHAPLQALFGEWVVDAALALVGQLMDQGLHLPVSINITPEHLHREGFAEWMASRMALHPHVPARLLHLELTESAALYDVEHVARELSQLRAQGVGVSFDDFGTGYSSLSYLRRLPLDHLKLDRSFVAGMLQDAGDRAIVRGVIGLGRSFGCETIAEGVETVEQGRMLLQMGCQLAQGFCIAPPMPAAEFSHWVRGWRAPARWRDVPAPLAAEPA